MVDSGDDTRVVPELHDVIWEIYHILAKHDTIRKDRTAFRQSCSALDAIGDTGLALGDYITCEETFGTGITYILAYGVLQAIFLQQDAVRHLAHSLSCPVELPEELREIRELRNEAVGHPTEKKTGKDGKTLSFHHIARVTLTQEGFQLLSSYSDVDYIDVKDVNLHEMIRTQMIFTEEFLSHILKKLKTGHNG